MVHVKCLAPTDPDYNFLYCPSFPAAVLFSVLFGLTTLGHIVQAILYRKKFCGVIIVGGLWETFGLFIRVFSVLHTTSNTLAIASQLFILLAPLWINAFLYVLMARLVYLFVPEKRIGRIEAQRLSLAFLIQAVGGSIGVASDTPKMQLIGIHVYEGGIALQQLFILGFIGLVIRFQYKMRRLEGSTEWKRPLYTIYVSLGLITTRIIYRLVEYSGGVYTPITLHEAPFYCLDALPMFAALLLWNTFHPGPVLVGPESEFPKKSRKERKAEKAARAAA
ncbi:RTA1 like protein-domain-containing protein [Mycena alexandri]|uniref:RTA1 like protein-domain-containing protein n=1 Tax=Mycena alexandri TaxID=1745969 RepID=A0AAD6T379_9AGAR|nr:RTA1 like protein-domain-containing protein [Mycena alexandri]